MYNLYYYSICIMTSCTELHFTTLKMFSRLSPFAQLALKIALMVQHSKDPRPSCLEGTERYYRACRVTPGPLIADTHTHKLISLHLQSDSNIAAY